jgi:hypothetical protein
MTKQTKKPLKTEYCTLADIFPWLKMEKLTRKEYEKRNKKREAMEKKHPRLKVHAYGENMERVGSGWIIRDAKFFIDASEADPKQKKELTKWLHGQTCPLIPGVEAACYSWDYQKWYSAFIDGRVAEVTD